jgi:endonuclease-3
VERAALAYAEAIAFLRKAHPKATTELDWKTPFELLIATILAAQCTDERVNGLTPALFRKYPTPEAFARADLAGLEVDLKPTGFFRQKSKAVKGASAKIVEDFGGKVPETMAELVELPGVARKTANVVLGTALGKTEGIAIDTHVHRVSKRFRWVSEDADAAAIEEALMANVPKRSWTWFGHALTLHGRYTCKAKKPRCGECGLRGSCPSSEA